MCLPPHSLGLCVGFPLGNIGDNDSRQQIVSDMLYTPLILALSSLSLVCFQNHFTEGFDDLRDDGIAESPKSVHPMG